MMQLIKKKKVLKMEIKEKIEWLLNGQFTAYSIAKAIGVHPTQIQRFINGERAINNMTLGRAIELYELAVKWEKDLLK